MDLEASRIRNDCMNDILGELYSIDKFISQKWENQRYTVMTGTKRSKKPPVDTSEYSLISSSFDIRLYSTSGIKIAISAIPLRVITRSSHPS